MTPHTLFFCLSSFTHLLLLYHYTYLTLPFSCPILLALMPIIRSSRPFCLPFWLYWHNDSNCHSYDLIHFYPSS